MRKHKPLSINTLIDLTKYKISDIIIKDYDTKIYRLERPISITHRNIHSNISTLKPFNLTKRQKLWYILSKLFKS